jgi:6-pyruvoyltetrahydropterin/6-carboxytetrahydropterin synthase
MFGCQELDENGFVVDFGALKYIRRWLDEHLDHACVFNRDDPLREVLVAAAPNAWKPHVVENCSAEGIARHLFEEIGVLVEEATRGRVHVVSVRVDEDARNSAFFTP